MSAFTLHAHAGSISAVKYWLTTACQTHQRATGQRFLTFQAHAKDKYLEEDAPWMNN